MSGVDKMDVGDIFWGIGSFICNKELLLDVFAGQRVLSPNRKTAGLPRSRGSRLAATEEEVQERRWP